MNRAGRKAIVLIGMAALAGTAASAVAVANPVASASAKKPLLIANCAKPKFKPVNLIFTCGDASFGATNVVWSGWSRKKAVGAGIGQINNCKPNCAQGKTKDGPIQVRATKPRTCSNGRRIFTKMSWSWTSGAPVGNVPDSGSVPVGCKLLGQ